jgi:hypothetical protein
MIVVRLALFSNTDFPKLVTLLGIVTEVKSGHFANTCPRIAVTLYSTSSSVTVDGITISPLYLF